MRTKYGMSTVLILAHSKWLMCGLVASYVLTAAGCKQETDSSGSSENTRELLTGRPAYASLHSDAYIVERAGLIDSAATLASDGAGTESFHEVLEGWESESAPMLFWQTVDSVTGVLGVLLTYEVGSSDSYHYWGGALIRTADGLKTVSCAVNKPRDLIWRLVDEGETVTIMSHLEDEFASSELTAEICTDIVDAPMVILLVYIGKRRCALISNCVDDPCCPEASRVLPYVNRIFGVTED